MKYQVFDNENPAEIPDSRDFLENLQGAKFMLLDCEGFSEPSCYTNWKIFPKKDSKDKMISFTNRNESAYFTVHTERLEKISDNCYQHSQFRIYLLPH